MFIFNRHTRKSSRNISLTNEGKEIQNFVAIVQAVVIDVVRLPNSDHDERTANKPSGQKYENWH